MQKISSAAFVLLTQLTATIAFYTSSWAATSQWTVTFPLRNIQRSFDLGTPTMEELHLPTGKCEDYPEKNLSLILPHAGLRRIFPGFIESPYVSCLSLRDNQIDRISTHAFNDVPNLLFLDLSKNRIPFCDLLIFNSNHKLRTLVLDENDPPSDNVGRIIFRSNYFPSLEHLYLRKNYLLSLQFSLRMAFPQLTHLYLSDNYIESENFIKDIPACLRHLHVERNRIQNFGGIILRNLISLFIDGNKIRTVCFKSCFGLKLQGGKKLKFLSLLRNNITKIEPDTFYEAHHVEFLNVAFNKIDNIAYETFENLPLLKDLSLDGNHLRVVPNLQRNQQLINLSMNQNQIQIIDAGAFKNLTSLRWLSLSNNKICRIECNAFLYLQALEELDLSINKLSHLALDCIRPKTSLKHLDLTGNYFTYLEHLSLQSSSSLLHVYLQNNPVASVKTCSELAVEWFSSDIMIHLTNGCKIMGNSCYERCYDTVTSL